MPTTYDQILPLLIGKDEITIGNNTVATWSTVDAAISVLLHGHEIIRVYGDGTVTVRHCGYPTRTTLDRINRFIQPIGWKANLRNGAAYVDWMMLHTDEWVHLTQV
jgi:hypothetical protein